MAVEAKVVVGQLLRLDASGVHVSRWTAYQSYVAEGVEFQRLKDSIMFMSGNVQPIGVRRVGRWPEGSTAARCHPRWRKTAWIYPWVMPPKH